jgi:hypothetical protein
MPPEPTPSADDTAPLVVFPFAVSLPFAHAGRLFGVDPEHARLELSGLDVRAVFGPWSVETTIDNVESVDVTGPYSPIKVIGPPHLSLSDRGLTFATNADEGICIRFRRPVPGLVPISWLRHPSLTLTVAEPHEVQSFLERATRELGRVDADRAEDAVAQVEHDSVVGLTSAELRKRARALGVERVAEKSHDDLVSLLAEREQS